MKATPILLDIVPGKYVNKIILQITANISLNPTVSVKRLQFQVTHQNVENYCDSVA